MTVINIKKPAPIWFQKLKKIISLTTNTVILALLLFGYTNDSLILLILKLGSSYIMSILDILLANKDDETKFDETIFPTESEPKGPKTT